MPSVDIQEKISSIRKKPVENMTAPELVFIYKSGSINKEEAIRLRALIEKKKASDKSNKPSVDGASRSRQVPSSGASVSVPTNQKEPTPTSDLSQDFGDTDGFLPVGDVHSAITDTEVQVVERLRETSNVVPGTLLSDVAQGSSADYKAQAEAYAAFAQMGDLPPSPAEELAARDAQVPSPRSNSFWYKFARSARRFLKEPVFMIAIIGIVFLVFSHAFFIPSGSMRPTLMEGDRIFTIPLPFPSGSTYQRGDIACFTAPDGTVYVKRVIGIGGDHIQISGEKVYVNGEESPYQGTGGVMTSMDIQLADDEYWMMGDNRGNSEDSRFIGPVKADKMIAKVIAVYLPLEHAKLL